MAATSPAALSVAPVRTNVESLAIALQDSTRRRMLLDLVDDDVPRTVDEVAGRAGVHRTVAFTHLERLAALGYVTKTRRRGHRGKPAALYQARAGVIELSLPARQFLLLGRVLGTALGSLGPRGRAAARAHGRVAGLGLGAPSAPTVGDALRALNELGTTYTVDGRVVATRHCVFREACDDARDIVCNLHAGLIEGALEAADIHASVSPRGPVSDAGCAFTLTT